ncbi:hypothetical protein CJD36_002055 [Flavipsychrobacter stenotrophus]|uniref:Fibronectin type-III domain-containing protein n=1 Tax=Flavipsychrobacter stenotrophus TaxID=2077091 RepID=A0A2S7T020_9BACT|nr:hypothetical protein CJD36_002055 [Flavipsychrobacter stenotrophus]
MDRVFAQASTANYTFTPGATGSLALDLNANVIDLSTGATALVAASIDDGPASPITTIPFDFWFMGVRYTSFSVTANGALTFATTPGTTLYTLPNGSTPTLSAFANDLMMGTDGQVRSKVFGTAPNRTYVVEWLNDMIRYNLGVTGPGTGTWQIRLYENTGIIEYVYGAMTTNPATPNAYYVGFSNNTTTNNVMSVNTAALTASTVAPMTSNTYTSSSTITELNSAADGSRKNFKFASTAPNAPSGVTATAGLTTATLNWVDNSTNEQGFVIYASPDGITYTFAGQAAANATTLTVGSLLPSTLYSFKVYAVSEGALSTAAPIATATTTACAFAGIKTVGPTGDFANIHMAVNFMITNGISASSAIELQTTYLTSSDTLPIVINAIPCASASNTLTIRPQGTLVMSGTGTALFDLNGANYVVIDGRVGSTGTAKALTISNTGTGAAVRFINDASNNKIIYTTLTSTETSTTNGVILFSTTTGSAGNDNNLIDNNDILDGTTAPANGIYSSGTAGKENDHNTVSNNNIANYFSAGSATNGIFLTTGNTDWTITANRFYQTATRTYTTTNTHRAIQIANTAGNNFTVTNNIIGYATNAGTGIYTMTGTVGTSFVGIAMSAGTTTASTIQGNTITGIGVIGAAGTFTGINVSNGNVNVGNITPNVIGSTTATDAIVKSNSTSTSPSITGISQSSAGAVLIQGNLIGGLTSAGSTTATGSGIVGIVATSGTVTITGNTIGSTTIANSINGSTVSSGTGTVYGINASTGPALAITNNTIANLNNNGTATGSLTAGILCSGSAPAVISGNSIHDISGATASTTITGQEGVCGIAFTGSATAPAITQNTIYAISATNNTAVTSNAAGIGISNATNATVTRNRIYDIRNASTGTTATTPPTADGIVIGNVSTGITVANNMVSLGNIQTTNTSFTGIWNSVTTTAPLNIYYNSVNVEGSVTSGALASAAFHRGNYSATAVTSTVDVKNNIFVNTRNGGSGKHYAIANGINVVTASTLGWASNASNYNILNATAATIGYWSGDQTFATWQGASLSDGNSYGNTSVVFTNTATGDLHINMGIVANNLESHGLAITGLSTDFDNDTRPGPIGSVNGGGTASDIGADEFDGTLVDNIAPNMVYTSLPNTCGTGDVTVSVTITDPSGVPVAGSGLEPRIYFKKGVAGTYFSVAGTLSSGTVTNGVWGFTIPVATLGGVAAPDHIYYYIIAQDVFANVGANPSAGLVATSVVSVTTPPVAPAVYSILPGAGTFTVGVGGNYTTINEAVNAYNLGCLTGPIVFNLTDVAYPSETYPITINGNAGASSVNTLTIQPAVGVAVSLTSSAAATAVFKLTDAKYVTIDGLNTAGSSLSITNGNTGTSTNIWLASATTGNSFIALKNMNITGGSNSTTGDWGILSGINGATPSGTAGADNDNVTIQGNTMLKCGYGVYAFGTATASAGGLDNWTISGNTFGPTTTGANSFGYNGLYMGSLISVTISNNTIRNIGTSSSSTQSVGINLSSNVNGFTISGNNVNNIIASASVSGVNSVAGISIGNNVINGTISRNTITAISNISTGGWGGRALILNTANATSAIDITNNIIADIFTYSDAGSLYWPMGINIDGTTGGVNIYNNSVNLFGTHSGLTGGTGSAALFVSAGASALNVRNNILVNTYDNTSSSTDKGYSIYSLGTSAAFTAIDYNDYAATTPDVLGNIGGIDATNLAGIQTNFGGNTHSLNLMPVFVSNTDLHLQPVTANAGLMAGTPIAGITVDIDGTVRSVTAPIIGAHEVSIPTCGVVTAGTALPLIPSFCVTGSTTISLSGASTGLGISIQWYSSSDSATFTAISGATNNTYTIAPAITSTTYYRAVISCSYSGNIDSASTRVKINPLPTIAVTPDGGSMCLAGTGVSMVASGALTYTWSPSTALSATTGAAVTATPTITTAYVVSGTDLNGCVNTHTSTVVVNYAPGAITFTPALPAICAGSSTSITAAASIVGPGVAATQTFNSGLGSWMVDNTGTTDFDAQAPWQLHPDGFVSPEGDTYHSPDNSSFVSTNADNNGSGTVNISRLVSPVFSLSNYVAATVSFQHYYRVYGTGDVFIGVEITTDGGATWSTLQNYTGTAAGTLTGFAPASIDLASYLGAPAVQLRWRYHSAYGYYWAVDNISVAGTTSIPATNITWSPSTGLFNDAALTSPYTGTAAATVYAAPAITAGYTVTATNTGCSTTGSVSVTVNPLPLAYAVTGTGSYCSGGTGVAVGLVNSEVGVNYQLYNGATAVGTPVAGTGSAISFGLQTTAATYTVVATNATTSCTNNMTGSAVVSIDPLPTAFTITGGGDYCIGGTGVAVGLFNSTLGVSYQLYNGAVTVGSPVAGTGSAISFGLQTAAGTYTVVGTNLTTTCVNNMLGATTVTIDPLPTAYAVTGGGSYCFGGAGMAIGLGNSDAGVNYQLYNGATAVGSPVAGTGAAIGFGLQTTAGTYTVVATNGATTCVNNMTGSATIAIDPLPLTFAVTGTGSYCAGGAGVAIGLLGSQTGVNYQLFNGATAVGTPVAGTGSAISFGLQTTAATYTVVATNTATTCTNNMTGSATVTINPLPTAFAVTGGGGYCSGGTGSVVGLFNSQSGVTYQLYLGTSAVGTPVAGTGSAISFGAQTAVGSYTVVATNTVTTCVNNMTGSVTVSIDPLPTVYNTTGGGNYCAGGTGVAINLSNSQTGVNYQLFNGSSPVGAPVAGTGSGISFGLQTAAGTYAVSATNATTSCTSNMNGFPVITVDPLPTAFAVTGGGSYCAGGTGMTIGLINSTSGVNYQLFNGASAVGSPVSGIGAAISFGLQTAAGTYTVNATNTSTTCTNLMTGSATITITPIPTAYTISAGGSYCSGGAGVTITLSNSATGVNYQLFNGAVAVGSPVAGTGSSISFGAQSAAGTYTVVATSVASSCTNIMTGSATITISPLPIAYTVTGGGGYCTGGTGMAIGLSNSDAGLTYQLFNGATAVGTAVAGTGSSISFGLQTTAGTYTVVATNSTTTCTNNMLGSATITVNALPTAYTVTGGGGYCAGGTGMAVGLSNSQLGVTYQLYLGGSPVGTPLAGTGTGAISFGLQTTAGSYTVVATNTVTTCTNNMTGSVTISINPLPAAFTISAGGSYCSGGTGVTITLSNSVSGVNYQLYLGATAVGSVVSGTGSSISFGSQTAAGIYTATAIDATTGCTATMTGSATITIVAPPLAFAVTGGGSLCAGGAGVAVGLANSAVGVNYQLFNGATAIGTPVAGTGSSLNFGLQTTAGTYTVVATNTTTTCSITMTGSATVTVNPLPIAYTVTGGGSYCTGGTGVAVGLSNSETGVSYQLFLGATAIGTPVSGVTGTAISFGVQTTAGIYTVVATSVAGSCTTNMTGSVTISIDALPTLYAVTGGGSYCIGGTGVAVGLGNSDLGVNYQLYLGTPVGAPVAGTGGAISFGLQTTAGAYTVVAINASSCSATMTGSATVSISTLSTVSVSVSTGVGDTVCDGTLTTFTATPVNGGAVPAYSWSVNGAITTSTGPTYSYVPTSGDIVSVTLTSSAACVIAATASTADTIYTAINQTPLLSIAATPDTVVCAGTPVTFTASGLFGGTTPVYAWVVNGAVVGSGSIYTYTPANGDIVGAVMVSNFACVTNDTAISNIFTIDVNPVLTPAVTISAAPGTTIGIGATLTLTAGVTSGGSSTIYQWYVNGVAVTGATNSTYVNSGYTDGDTVYVIVNASPCGGNATNGVVVHVTNGVDNVTTVAVNVNLMPNPNNGTFSVKGTLAGSNDQEVTMEITNMIGQVVYRQNVIVRNGEVNELIQLDGIVANGAYLLNFRSGADTKQFHFILNR